MLLFRVCHLLHLIHTPRCRVDMPRVSRAISALAAIAIPPLPQFSQPSQLGRTPYWDRYVTVMPALFKCKQSKAPAHTILHTTTLLGRGIWHIIHSPLPPLLFSFARVDESIPMFDPVPADIVGKKWDPGILDPSRFSAQIRKVEARLGKLAKIRKVETN